MLWHCAGDGGKKARSPGRLRRKPLKPSRRECWKRFGDLWWTYSYAFFICMRGCGCGGASGIPCALFPLRDDDRQSSGEVRCENAESCHFGGTNATKQSRRISIIIRESG